MKETKKWKTFPEKLHVEFTFKGNQPQKCEF